MTAQGAAERASPVRLAAGEGARVRDRGAFLLFSVLFFLMIGLRNGEMNQVFYLLGGLRRADPAVLAHDWYTTSTEEYHLAWSIVIGALERLGMLEAGLAAGSVLLVLAFTASLLVIMRSLYERALLPWALTLLVFAGFYTRGIGDLVLIPSSIEPFGIAAVSAVAGLAFLARSCPLAAGIAWGIGAFFHAHYALLLAGSLVPLTIVMSLRARPRELLELWVPFLLLGLPSWIALAGAAAFPGAREVYDYLSGIGQQHYYPWRVGGAEFLRFAAALMIGAGGAIVRPPRLGPWLAAALIGMGAVVFLGLSAALTDAFWMINRTLPWRLASLLMLFGAAFGAAGLLATPSVSRPSACAGWTLIAAGLLLFAVAGPARMRGVVLVAAALPVLDLALRKLRMTDRFPAAVAAAPAILIAAGMAPSAIRQGLQSHVALDGTPGAKAALYAWARTQTPRDEIFIVPPEWRDFRLNARRAIIADWWATPLAGQDALEHRDRLFDLAGGRTVRDFTDLASAYDAMDCAAALRLSMKYGAHYVVLPRGRSLPCGAVAYENDGFVAIALPDTSNGPGSGGSSRAAPFEGSNRSSGGRRLRAGIRRLRAESAGCTA